MFLIYQKENDVFFQENVLKLEVWEWVEILVTSQLFERLKNSFPSAFSLKENKTPFLLFADQKVEIFKDLPPFEGQEQEVIARAEYFDGVPYMAFDDLIAFKEYTGVIQYFFSLLWLFFSKNPNTCSFVAVQYLWSLSVCQYSLLYTLELENF